MNIHSGRMHIVKPDSLIAPNKESGNISAKSQSDLSEAGTYEVIDKAKNTMPTKKKIFFI